MGKASKTRAISVKRMLNPRDQRRKVNQKPLKSEKEKSKEAGLVHPKYRRHYFSNTNFINHSIQNKLELVQAMMDCLYAKCIPCITDCVMAELEKLGSKYRIALRIARDPRFERLPCTHKGTFADDCIIARIMQHKCYIVATNDKELKTRIRKVPGIPIMYVANHKYAIERLPDSMM